MINRFALLLLALAAASVAQAAERAVPKADIAKGQASAAACIACHGADGNSPPPVAPAAIYPKLAGQFPQYLEKQIKNFKMGADGKPPERVNAIMNGMAMALATDDDVRNVAAYFASQKQVPDAAKDAKTVEAGQKLWRAGDLSKGLPACAGCHGPTGAGLPAQYPRLAGQWADYIEAQLKAFRNEERTNDLAKVMRMIALKMTDKEIKAVADYAAGLR
ncbi:MAG: c-type cytochrome [Rhodocyclaceae bacterium]|nr:c-type cytochrome [Rhodocyclaceae bacterium]